jgi:hypothetical protein
VIFFGNGEFAASASYQLNGATWKDTVRQDLVEQLNTVLDEQKRKKLIGYALKLVRNPLLDWRIEKDLVKFAEDLVSEAICKTLAGERQWDPATTPDPIKFLASTIKSLVSAHYKNERNSEFLRELDAPSGDLIHEARLSPHDRAESEEFLYGLIEACEDDEVCATMVDLFEKGYKPGEVAEKLNLLIQEIYAAKKRLIRITEAYLQKRQVGN